MQGIERANRLAREWLPRAFDDLGTDPQHVPVGRRRHQVGPPVSGLSFRQLAEHDRTPEHAVTFDHRQVRRNDDLGRRQDLSDL